MAPILTIALIIIAIALLPVALTVFVRLFLYMLAGGLFLGAFLLREEAPWLALGLLTLGGLLSFAIAWRQDRREKADVWESGHTHECDKGHVWVHRGDRECPLPGSGSFEGAGPWPRTRGPIRAIHCPDCHAGKPEPTWW